MSEKPKKTHRKAVRPKSGNGLGWRFVLNHSVSIIFTLTH